MRTKFKKKIDKKSKTQNQKSKHWGLNLKYYQILNWRAELKRKIKFIKKSKTKIKMKKMKTKYIKKLKIK